MWETVSEGLVPRLGEVTKQCLLTWIQSLASLLLTPTLFLCGSLLRLLHLAVPGANLPYLILLPRSNRNRCLLESELKLGL